MGAWVDCLKVDGIWFDEIDGETPSMARGTRALPNCIVPAQSAPEPPLLAPLFGNLFWQTLSIEIDPRFLSQGCDGKWGERTPRLMEFTQSDALRSAHF